MSTGRTRVRVFVPTFRRPHLLVHALDSLRAQTVTDWICELHNDDPDDPGPARIVERLGDSRISYHGHAKNLGGTATFNLFFRPTPEPFYAVLEDDNAWAPEFLSGMLRTAERFPDATIFWCNQRVRIEQADGTLNHTTRTVRTTGGPAREMPWGQFDQMFGALHANGAMLVRSRSGDDFQTPAVPLSAIEAFRERAFPHPMIFVPDPLADFTITRQTARANDRHEWALVQSMLVATFLKHAPRNDAQHAQWWSACRSARPPRTNPLLLASLAEPGCRWLRRHANPIDWLRLVKSVVRHPSLPSQIRQSRRTHADWWEFLDRHTARRYATHAAAR
jgi:glycosyltransferase involved in cell wall biosynthesis